MHFLRTLCSLALAGPLLFSGDVDPEAVPAAMRVPHVETRHGQVVQDDYVWLRDPKDPAVLNYLKAENAHATWAFAPLAGTRDALLAEMKARLLKSQSTSTAVVHHGYVYYSRAEEGKNERLLCRRRVLPGAKEEVYLDLNELARGHAFFQLGLGVPGVGARALSADNRRLAYSTDVVGDCAFSLHVKNLASGETLRDIHPRVTSAAWSADGGTLFFSTESDAKARRSDQVWAMRIGQAPVLRYEEKEAGKQVFVTSSRDNRYLFLEIKEQMDTREIRVLDARAPQGDIQMLFPRERGAIVQAEHRNGRFFLRTDQGASGFRILTAPVSYPTRTRERIMPREDAEISGMSLFREHLVLQLWADGVPRVEIVDLRTGRRRQVAFPDPLYSVRLGDGEMRFTPDFGAKFLRLRYESPSSAPKVYDCELATGKLRLVSADVGPAPGRYVTERAWVTARDGVRVPVSLVHARGFRKDGTAPLLLTGYGFYGGPFSIAYDPHVLSLLDRGMVYAIAHVRGGSDLGEPWHTAGMGERKMNTFTDFIDCAEALAQDGWCDRGRMAATGISAGGILVGAVANLRPDLFRAMVAEYPAMDYLSVCYDTTLDRIAAWADIREVGDPAKDPEVYHQIARWSPYENVAARKYPALLLWTALNDSNVHYWHPARYAARMRALNPGSLDLVMQCDTEGTHGGSGGRFGNAERLATIYAWLLDRLDVKNRPDERTPHQ